MDIKSTNGIERIDATRRVTAETRRGETPEPESGGGSADQLTLTSAIRRLMDSATSLGEGPPIDHARIEAIRKDLADGSYEIDAEKIAAALIRTEQELG